MDTDGRWISLVTPEDLNRSKLEWAKESRSHMQFDDVGNMLNSVQNLHRVYLVAALLS